ncbi:ferric reductase-like transmembrane domain-containing protein [Kribbella sp. NPDC004536]|uniref:ferredoxin reductase family protein n=1 Tax=Kribbella sp. NPDC004536 TaxID=3364106 RepID=UPI00367DD1B4
MSRHRVSARLHGPLARLAWFLWYVAVLLIPLFLARQVIEPPDTSAGGAVELSAGLVAFSALVVAVALPARLPWLIAAFGIETVVTVHRLIALVAVVLVLVHFVAVLVVDPRGLSILDLAHTTWAARAAVVSTLALVLVVFLALRRPHRQPRYEGWRLVHNGLVGIVVLTAWLHVWWLRHLVSHLVLAVWFVVSGLVLVGLAARRWIWLPVRAGRFAYVVVSVRAVSGDGVTLVIQADGHRGLPFEAGQFVWLKIGSTPFVFEEHPFSIASTAEHPERMEFTIKALGDFTELLVALRPGRRVFLDGPYGGFTIEGLDDAPGFVFIAAGVGITPLLSMLRTLADRGDQRLAWLIMSARTQYDLMLRPEVSEVRARLKLKVIEVVSAPEPGWIGAVGRIDRVFLDQVLPRRAQQLHYFLCGPTAMVTSVGRDLAELGVPLRRIHTERFGAV